MKKYSYYCISILLLFNCCSKSANEENPDCIVGGFGTAYSYRFWTSIPMYYTSVEVKNSSGEVVFSNSKITEGYYLVDKNLPNFEPDACKYDASKEAVFQLTRGQDYSFTARNESRVFSGVINVPCRGETACYNVRLQ